MPEVCRHRPDRRRNIVKRLIGWLKEIHHIPTRFEKIVADFLGAGPALLALIQQYLKPTTYQ
ncbi:hypothetical protein LOC68_00935 [Blastopirellula sp. JC732]|uniref:Transposase n=1 Tax=Blastopirellula sediminis TaxID=2894196 RepID=A0A9X1MK64_9BACT|nr:hypothetical protein [Blastopirellula sediminis]MCC9626959.1 hypothetical protein [Blastopirellula sediminis]